MGTHFELLISDGEKSSADLKALGEAAMEQIDSWSRRLDVFARDSQVSALNRDAAGGAVPVDGEMLMLLCECHALWEATKGAFDAALGFHMQVRGFRGREPVPPIPRATNLPGWSSVDLDERAMRVRFLDTRTQLDFGGIAKGWALNAVREHLAQFATHWFFAHGGSSSSIQGGVAFGIPARVGLQHPVQGRALLNLSLDHQALSVSSPTGRVVNGQGHILDPASGESKEGVSLAAVRHESASVAEAWSTALVVNPELVGSGPECWVYP